MECSSCGSPLDSDDTECAFGGLEVNLEPDSVSSVPLEHQRGEGVEPAKTRQDSLREIARGIEKSVQSERRAVALHSHLPRLFLCTLVLGAVYAIGSLIASAHYESTLNGSILAIQAGEYEKARGYLTQAEDAWGSIDGEPEFFRGVSYFVEAQNSKESSRRLLSKSRDALGKSRTQNSDRPHPYLYQAALDLVEGHPTLAEDQLEKCLNAKDGNFDPYHQSAERMKSVLSSRKIPIFYCALQTGPLAVPAFKRPENGFELPAVR
jgi:hypothetical protein